MLWTLKNFTPSGKVQASSVFLDTLANVEMVTVVDEGTTDSALEGDTAQVREEHADLCMVVRA